MHGRIATNHNAMLPKRVAVNGKRIASNINKFIYAVISIFRLIAMVMWSTVQITKVDISSPSQSKNL